MTQTQTIARRALEEVCSGRDLASVAEVYHRQFLDHVNSLEHRGVDGARESVALYLELFSNLSFKVDEQITEGDRVVSRWTLTGTHRGRAVRLWGIVISRFEDGKIIEDWAASDTLTLVRQLGIWRSLLVVIKHHKSYCRVQPALDRRRAGRTSSGNGSTRFLRGETSCRGGRCENLAVASEPKSENQDAL